MGLLLESGDVLLLEDAGHLILESGPGGAESGGGITLDAYATLDELKAWLALNTDSDANDLMLAMSLETASAAVDEYCRRRFTVASGSTARSFRSRCGLWLFVDDCTGVTSVAIDGTTYDVTVEPVTTGRPYNTLRRTDGGRFPDGTASVVASWGWSATPARVKQATLILAAKLDARRNSPTGIESGNDAMGFIRILGVDKDVESLLNPLVRVARSFV